MYYLSAHVLQLFINGLYAIVPTKQCEIWFYGNKEISNYN